MALLGDAGTKAGAGVCAVIAIVVAVGQVRVLHTACLRHWGLLLMTSCERARKVLVWLLSRASWPALPLMAGAMWLCPSGTGRSHSQSAACRVISVQVVEVGDLDCTGKGWLTRPPLLTGQAAAHQALTP